MNLIGGLINQLIDESQLIIYFIRVNMINSGGLIITENRIIAIGYIFAGQKINRNLAFFIRWAMKWWIVSI